MIKFTFLSWEISYNEETDINKGMIKNLSKPRKQHWLPVGYMKFFSITGKPEGRKTKVYYSNAIESKTKKVENLSYSNYHYSRDNAKDTENSFQEMENDYPLIVEKILKGKDLVKKEYFGLIITIVDFHARNPSYKNLTKEENYKAFEIVSRGLMKEIFKDSKGGAGNLPEILNHLQENWVLQPILSEKEKFISSDHPSLLFSCNNEPAFIFLPISPHYGIIAIDKRKLLIIGNKASEKDTANLNALQTARCIRYVYSDHDLSNLIGEGKPITNWFSREKPKGFVNGDSWKPEFIDYSRMFPNGFSFLQVI